MELLNVHAVPRSSHNEFTCNIHGMKVPTQPDPDHTNKLAGRIPRRGDLIPFRVEFNCYSPFRIRNVLQTAGWLCAIYGYSVFQKRVRHMRTKPCARNITHIRYAEGSLVGRGRAMCQRDVRWYSSW